MSKTSTPSPVESIETLRQMQARAAALPPSSNTGGKDSLLEPSFVAECAPKPSVGETCIVDTLTFTFPLAGYSAFPDDKGLDDDEAVPINPELIRSALGFDLFDQLDLDLSPAVGRGKNFYKEHCEIRYSGHQHEGVRASVVGFVAFGGNNNTCCVHLTGKACEHISVLDHRMGGGADGSWHHVRSFVEYVAGKISRIDLAYDDLEGVQGGVNAAVDWYLDGTFTARGRRPSCSMAGDWLFSQSRTFYVGKRQNGKMIRVYEKGHQLGSAESKWVRYEVELHSVDRELPLDSITSPSQYLAGAAPCLAFVAAVPPVSIKTIVKEKAKLTLEHLTHWASVSYGRLLHVMDNLGITAEEMLDRLRVEGVPSRLDVPPALSSELPELPPEALGLLA